MIGNIFYGLLLMIGGAAILKYRKTVHDWTGGWGWAEHYLGRGGTYTAICLIACLMIGLWVVKFFGKIDFGGPVNKKWPQIEQTDISDRQS